MEQGVRRLQDPPATRNYVRTQSPHSKPGNWAHMVHGSVGSACTWAAPPHPGNQKPNKKERRGEGEEMERRELRAVAAEWQ
eukprot:scaffold32657_cov31-Tisochrysis_lutea.AAC.5